MIKKRTPFKTVSSNRWAGLFFSCSKDKRKQRKIQGRGEDIFGKQLDIVYFLR